MILLRRKNTDEWRDSVLVPIYENKGDIQDYRSYRGVKHMSHPIKIWERITEGRLRDMVYIGENQLGFMPGRNTTDAVFALRQLIVQYRERQQNLHCVFIDLEKTYNCVPREKVWNYLRLKSAQKHTFN